MSGHDIVVIGSSAGGIKALGTIVSNLPSDIDAAIFIVQHLAPNSPSFLPQILQDVGSLSAIHPADKQKIVNGQIYVALLRELERTDQPLWGLMKRRDVILGNES